MWRFLIGQTTETKFSEISPHRLLFATEIQISQFSFLFLKVDVINLHLSNLFLFLSQFLFQFLHSALINGKSLLEFIFLSSFFVQFKLLRKVLKWRIRLILDIWMFILRKDVFWNPNECTDLLLFISYPWLQKLIIPLKSAKIAFTTSNSIA
jgi:hypothetical protein